MDPPALVNFSHSLKNIPIPPKNSYKKRLIVSIEKVIKRMRWKAFFFLRRDDVGSGDDGSENFGFNTKRCPPQISEMMPFEDELLRMVECIRFRTIHDAYQTSLFWNIVPQSYIQLANQTSIA